MGRPRGDDPEHRAKRDAFYRMRAEGKGIREIAKALGVNKNTISAWEAERKAPEIDPLDQHREFLQRLIAEGFPEEVARAPQIYWRVRLGKLPPGATAWHTETLAIFVDQPLDFVKPVELFNAVGSEGHELWLKYLAAMAKRAGLVQGADGTWTADPAGEPLSR